MSDNEAMDDRQADFELWLRDPELADRLQQQELEEICYVWGDKFMNEGIVVRSPKDLK